MESLGQTKTLILPAVMRGKSDREGFLEDILEYTPQEDARRNPHVLSEPKSFCRSREKGVAFQGGFN